MNQQINQFFTRPVHYFFIILSISLIVISTPTNAEDYGRYRAIVMQEDVRMGMGQTTNSLPKVFIIDSKDGHMWTWEQKKKIKGHKKSFTLGTVLTYQGRVKPGDKMGDIVEQSALE